MEPRRIIKFGNSSYVISIPKEWIKENQIKKGDLIFLDTSPDGELIIKPKENQNKEEPRQVTMDISKRDFWSIKRELNFFYIDDFDLIILKGAHPERDKIENVIKKMIGSQIIENSNELLIIKNILDLESITIKDIFRRTDNLIRSMFMELKEGFEKEKVSSESLKSIYQTDLEINSLYFLLMKIIRKGLKDRQFSKKINKEPLELNYLHHLILNIEIIGDHIKRIAKTMNIHTSKSKNIKEIQKILEMTEKTYEETMISYYTNNQEIARKVAEETREIKLRAEEMIKNEKSASIGSIIEHLKDIANRLHFISKILAY